MYEPPADDRFGLPEDESEDDGAAGSWSFDISQADLIGLTVVVAILVVLTLWLGAPIVMVILGGAAGGFVTALVCPFLGCDHVLDDIRIDILKCLALAGYLILGFWGVVAGIRVIVESVHGPGAPLFLSRGIMIVFLFTFFFLGKVLWMDSGKLEYTVVTIGTMVGAVMMAVAVT